MSQPCFALVDCNNFFVSCERLFRPDLKTRPVLVLSNNDGCVIARSNEVKALGIKMGVPFYQIRHIVQQNNIAIFSTNFPLYLDISRRVYNNIEAFSPHLEQYSIDESFIDLTSFQNTQNIYDYCQEIRWSVTRNTGIPVSVSAAPTKTLAKLASYGAKHNFTPNGVMTIDNDAERVQLLKNVPLEEVWGIGRALTAKLSQNFGVRTAYDLSILPPLQIQRHFNITTANVVRELNGESCIPLEEIPKPKKQMMWSRTFSHKVTNARELYQILARFTVRIGEKLREEKQYTKNFGIFVQTNSHSTVDKQYSNCISIDLPFYTNDTTMLLNVLPKALMSIYKKGINYYKAGVIVQDLSLTPVRQFDFFAEEPSAEEVEKRNKAMSAIDQINSKYKDTIFFAAMGTKPKENISNQQNLSPSYTTRWCDIPIVK